MPKKPGPANPDAHPVTFVKPWPAKVLKSPQKLPGQTKKTSPTQK
jgi:hypothetical protein